VQRILPVGHVKVKSTNVLFLYDKVRMKQLTLGVLDCHQQLLQSFFHLYRLHTHAWDEAPRVAIILGHELDMFTASARDC
jgi:hypothetical protein